MKRLAASALAIAVVLSGTTVVAASAEASVSTNRICKGWYSKKKHKVVWKCVVRNPKPPVEAKPILEKPCIPSIEQTQGSTNRQGDGFTVTVAGKIVEDCGLPLEIVAQQPLADGSFLNSPHFEQSRNGLYIVVGYTVPTISEDGGTFGGTSEYYRWDNNREGGSWIVYDNCEGPRQAMYAWGPAPANKQPVDSPKLAISEIGGVDVDTWNAEHPDRAVPYVNNWKY